MEINGFQFLPGALDAAAQTELVDQVMAAARTAPFYQPQTPGGRTMSVLQTSLGPLGWVTDAVGYRYEPAHPITARPWPPMPEPLWALWRRYCPGFPLADAALVNLYRPGARMGLHRDEDEADLSVPVLSISLGDTAVFRLGGLAAETRRGPCGWAPAISAFLAGTRGAGFTASTASWPALPASSPAVAGSI